MALLSAPPSAAAQNVHSRFAFSAVSTVLCLSLSFSNYVAYAAHSGGARLCGSISDSFTVDEMCVCSKGKEGERNENFGEHFQFR